ncbi:hypothetical protein E0L36_01965 [Streptomyces sp. AJS327]|uniref:hypothetical protein n=1 Tax=Streptomyces sp. AJS327 TaxID=2545265 RepID=UPI0015DE7ADC|nr:hypothetical protein [Streptomyces sp. AJS327]MBA0049712.1 hypothetical protein [Streptomyces sp. AJS327]
MTGKHGAVRAARRPAVDSPDSRASARAFHPARTGRFPRHQPPEPPPARRALSVDGGGRHRSPEPKVPLCAAG